MMELNNVLPIRKQDEVVHKILEEKFAAILPEAMRKAGIDMWVILCQEDDLDPVFKTMMPVNCWAPILQMLVFYDRGVEEGIERVNISMTNMQGLFESPWKGRYIAEQWEFLVNFIKERNPQKIGLNTGRVQWAAGGLTHNLYQQFLEVLPAEMHERIVSAEEICTHWLMTYSPTEKEFYPQVVSLAHQLIKKCYSRLTITPGVTTTSDVEWAYWQQVLDLGLEVSFKPFFNIIRSDQEKEIHPLDDGVIHPGDLLHCDVGIRYLRLCSDHQELAYVLKPGEADAPLGLKNLLLQNNRLQEVFLAGFKKGLSGDRMLTNMLKEAHAQEIPNPRIYSHSLGLYLHEPGPLIGLPWQQESNPGRGDVKLDFDSGFTMEISIRTEVPEWDNQLVLAGTEQDVLFTKEGCRPVDGVQTRLHLI